MAALSVHFSANSDRWATPRETFESLNREFAFDFDPCPLDGQVDGLAPLLADWTGKRVFCNPPYGREMGKWLRRGLEAEVSVFLIPARTDTKWFHDIVLPHAKEIRFLKGRLRFGDGGGRAPFPSMVVIFKRAPVTMTAREKAVAEPCKCVRCKACGGSGLWASRSTLSGDMDEVKTCPFCSAGIETCERCEYIAELDSYNREDKLW